MIRYLNQEEKEKTRQLYEQSFPEDSESFVHYYYHSKIRNNRVLVYEIDRKPVSMLHLNPYPVCYHGEIVQSYYIVAVATAPEERCKGYARALIERACHDLKAEGIPFVYLMPAFPDFYRQFGFEYAGIQTKTEYSLESFKTIANELSYQIYESELDENLAGRCARYMNSYLRKHYDIFTYRTTEYYVDMVKQLASEDGGIIIFSKNNDIDIAGLLLYTRNNSEIEVVESSFFDEDYQKQISAKTTDRSIKIMWKQIAESEDFYERNQNCRFYVNEYV
ncbi:MAG: GNAT family N-acetyltransferase [Lachnospiraceae bacterium]